MSSPSLHTRLARARFRAWHRGTREADYMIGGFFDSGHESWDEGELVWFEALLDHDDVDIIAWALGTAQPPSAFEGPMLARLRKLNYVRI